MSGFIMFLLIIGVIYIAFTYLKGPKNTDNYRNHFNMRHFNGDTWNDEELPELPDGDEIKMGADGEDTEEIGFEADEAGTGKFVTYTAELPQEPEAQTVPQALDTLAAPATPAVPAAPEAPEVPATLAAPDAILSEALQAGGVVIDSEVKINVVMPSDNK